MHGHKATKGMFSVVLPIQNVFIRCIFCQNHAAIVRKLAWHIYVIKSSV